MRHPVATSGLAYPFTQSPPANALASWYSQAVSFRSAAVDPLRTLAHARFLLLSVMLLSIAPACTDPQFRMDAGGEDTPQEDAGSPGQELDTGTLLPTALEAGCEAAFCTTPMLAPDTGMAGPEHAAVPDASAPDATLDPLHSMWVGRYAARSFLFSYDSPLKSSARLLTLAQIMPDADGGLVLDEQPCHFQGTWNFFGTGELRVEFPEVHYRSHVLYDAEHFHSAEAVAALGYTAEPPRACDAGTTTIAATDDQVWLQSTCDCPRSLSVLPTALRDCRLTDPDKDRMPGVTFQATFETSTVIYRVVQEERVRLHNGYRMKDRLYADREFLDTTKILNCVINGDATSADRCPIGAAKPCPKEHNDTELVPIPAHWGCAQIIERELSTFALQQPAFPASCPAELASR